MGIYYDYSKINGYHCPVKIVVSRRGLGKTFGKIKQYTERFLTKGYRFIYVVETGEMLMRLTQNKGEKFWVALLDYYAEQNTSRKRYFYNKLTSLVVDDASETGDDVELFGKRKVNTVLMGGTIKINGETAGYIVDMNSFGEIKRNNFSKIKYVLVDEFITEKLDKTKLENPAKISSIIQSIARLKDIEICLLGNTVRADDPILSRMGFKLSKYGFYKKYDRYGLLAVLHFVDPKDYPKFADKHERSVAGRFANMLGENHEEENKFIEDVPKSRRLTTFKYKKNGLLLNLIKEDVIVTLRELENGNIACVPFCGKNTTILYCLTEKEQGFKMGYQIICNKLLRQWIMDMVKSNIIFYYSEIEYSKLKIIIKGV